MIMMWTVGTKAVNTWRLIDDILHNSYMFLVATSFFVFLGTNLALLRVRPTRLARMVVLVYMRRMLRLVLAVAERSERMRGRARLRKTLGELNLCQDKLVEGIDNSQGRLTMSLTRRSINCEERPVSLGRHNKDHGELRTSSVMLSRTTTRRISTCSKSGASS